MADLCALCKTPHRKAADTAIDDVALCPEHARAVAMKRLGLSEADLTPERKAAEGG